MENLEDKTNNELLFELKKLEAEHEAIKVKMLNDYDSMIKIEEIYEKINNILLKRVSPNK